MPVTPPNNAASQKLFNDNINEYRSLLKGITDELGKQGNAIAAANREYSKLESIARQIQNTEEGINGLTAKQLEELKRKNNFSIDEIGNLAKQLLLQKGITSLTAQELVNRAKKGELSEKEQALLQGYLQDFELEKTFSESINKKLEERIKYETTIKELTGATGALISSMKGTMDALGMSSLTHYLNIDEAKKAMQEEADAIARGEKEGSKLSVRMAGIKTLAEGLNKALFSTEAIVGFIVKQLATGSSNMADFRKQTGIGYQNAYKLNLEMKGTAAASMDNFITSEKLNKSYAMMTTELGMSADVLGGKALVSATNLSERLGMSAEASSQLTVFSRLQGKDTEKILDNATATVGAYNSQNKTAINVKAVMNDVAGASKSMYLNMGKNVEAMAKAATNARALGLSLKQVEEISASLLNFEDSIGKELEANLLLGGGVNLAKAREHALTGDTAKLIEEIGKQESIRNAFATKNVIAQNAAAAALGITRDALAQMTLQNDLNTMTAERFKDAYGETTYESLKSRSAADALGDALAKVTDILGSIVQAFTPVIDALVWMLANPIAPYFLAAGAAVKVMGGSMGSVFGGFKDMLKGGGIGKGIKSMFGGKAEEAAASAQGSGSKIGDVGKAEEAAASAQGSGSKIGDVGKSAKGTLTGLSSGISSFGKVSVADIGKLALSSIALLLLTPAIPALLLLQMVQGPLIRQALTGLGKGLEAFGKAMSSGYALLGLAALALGVIALGYALNLAAPGIEAFGTVVTAVFSGLATLVTAVAAGFVTLMGAVSMEKILPMLLLGPALFGIAAGLVAVAGAGFLALPAIGGLVALAFAAPALIALGIGGGDKSVGDSKSKADEGSLAALEAKFDKLIAIVQKGSTINIDGKHIARATNMNMTQIISKTH